ncbi:MAG: thioredoxin-disulfide reductase [bacterium]
MADERQLIIVGAGPAGLTAALYAARNSLEPLVLEGAEPGGQLMTTTEVENFPGFPEPVMGPQLMQNMREQAARFGAKFVTRNADELDLSRGPFTATAGEDVHRAHALILATGARARLLGLEAERRLMGHGVSVCATCDGPFFRDKRVLIIGGGDGAMEEATFLTRFARQVTIVHRRDELRASEIMARRAMSNPKIDFLWSHVVVDILGHEQTGVTGAKVQDRKTDEVKEVGCEGVFLAIGHIPNTKLVERQLDLDDEGYVVVQDQRTLTSASGVFAAGDVVDHRYRQAVTAAGMGCMAALDAQEFLEMEA